MRRESRAQGRAGGLLPAPRPVLLSRPLVRVGLAGALLGCMGAAGAMVIVPSWLALLLALAMVGGVLALALVEERRLPRCLTCGADADGDEPRCAPPSGAKGGGRP